MKNKKGFMSISIIYSFLILFLILMFSILISYSNRINMVDSLVSESKNTLKTVKIGIIEKILIDNTELSDSGIIFTGIAGNGLYYTENSATYGENGQRIYYFRGRVDNNWINFAGYLWRIVRTTSEGGVKLVYSGNASTTSSGFIGSSSFNPNYNNKYYIGYTYNLSGYTGTQTNSSIKTLVDNWYNTNLSTYAGYLSDTAIYCNDRSVERISGSYTFFPPDDRLVTNKRPTYACGSANQSKYTANISTGNGYLQKPISLLTGDEVYYAGLIYQTTTNLNSYIMDNASGSDWWVMSPSTFSGSVTNVLRILNTGTISYHYTTANISVRPSVSLKSCVSYSSGNGTKSNPYIISDSSCS